MQDSLVHPAGNVELLTEHISTIYRDRALLNKLRARSLETRDELTWSAASVKLHKIYADAVEAKRKQQP